MDFLENDLYKTIDFPSEEVLLKEKNTNFDSLIKNLENNILKFSSGEWKWDEYDLPTAQNGRLNWDHLNISYFCFHICM